MLEQRRHQRIRFGAPPVVRIGAAGQLVEGVLENLSLSGLMLRSSSPLGIGCAIGCEFSLFGSPLIDMQVTVVSRVGDLFGVRFQPGLINEVLIDDSIKAALASGKASILSVHELSGRKVMRIAGGLNGALRNDFMHAVTRVGVDEIDLADVTVVEQAGLALCLVAIERHGAIIGSQSECFAYALKAAMALPGSPAAALSPE
jgi:hypothetical protein